MSKLIKDLFKSEQALGKIFAVITMMALIFTVMSPGTFADFWRTLAGNSNPYTSSTTTPTLLIREYGYGTAGWGYGYGYGYGEMLWSSGYYDGYDSAVDVTTGGVTASEATITGTTTNASSVVMDAPVSFTVGSIVVTLPETLEITEASGGTFDSTAIEAAVGTAVATSITANATIVGSADFGSTGEPLYFSVPVKVVIPISGVANGETVAIAVKHAGDSAFNETASLSTSASATCSSGVATPGASTATVTSGAVTVYTCAASKFVAYTSSDPGDDDDSTTTTTSGGGGGGGFISPNDSNTVTSIIASKISKIINKIRTISRPMEIVSSIIKTANGVKTALLTGSNGEITLKPNKESTIWAIIPSNTSVTGSQKWDGKIMPPLVRKDTVVSRNGEQIKGADIKLRRSHVDSVIKIGSNLSELTFNNPIDIVAPVDLADGTKVQILYSANGTKWEAMGKTIVASGKVGFKSKHFSYFVVSQALADEGLTDTEISSPIESIVNATTGFYDTKGHWAESYISRIADLGIVSGKTSSTFAPNDYITRAELTKIAMKAFSHSVAPSVGSGIFKDVSTSAWYAPYIVAAKNAGIVKGYSGNIFSPNGTVNRAEALKILIGAGGFEGLDENYQKNYASKPGWVYVFFPDVVIGEWFAKYVAYARDYGIVGGYGDGTFRPGNPITRAEVAKIVTKLMDM